MNTFCSLPFIHISNMSSGEIVPCCLSTRPIKDINGKNFSLAAGDSFKDAFYSQDMEQLRTNLKTGVRDERCKRCWDLEDQGLRSKRQYDGDRFLEVCKQRISISPLPFQPLSWDIKLGTLCNLKCRMCDPESSSAILSEHVKMQKITSDWAQRFLKKTKDYVSVDSIKNELLALSTFVEEIYFLGGEPSIMNGHLDILDTLIESGRSSQITIRWSTNLTHFSNSHIDRAKNFKHVILDCSVDGFSAVNDYIRYPSHWQDIEKNITHARQKLPTADIKIVCTVSLYNIFQLDELKKWSDRVSAQLVFNFLDQPEELCALNLDEDAKNKICLKYHKINHPAFNELRTWIKKPGNPCLLNAFLDAVENMDSFRKQDFFSILPPEAHSAFNRNYTQFKLPSENEFKSNIDKIYSREIFSNIQKVVSNVTQVLNKKNLLTGSDSLHGELNNFSSPYRGLVREHFNHLIFLEKILKTSQLKILDLSCGSGDFTYLARHRGHNCLASDPPFHKSISDINHFYDALSFLRKERQNIFSITPIDLFITSETKIDLPVSQLDVIYMNQCVFHFPNPSTNSTAWSNDSWISLFTQLANYLKDNGLFFMTLADPCYETLPPILKRFYTDYSLVFPNWKEAWWPLFIINKSDLIRFLNSSTYDSSHSPGWAPINRDYFMKDL